LETVSKVRRVITKYATTSRQIGGQEREKEKQGRGVEPSLSFILRTEWG